MRRVERERSPAPRRGQCAGAVAEAASLVLEAAAGKELHEGGSSFRQVRGCLQRAEASAAGRYAAFPPGVGSGEAAWPGPEGPFRGPFSLSLSPSRQAWRGRGRSRGGGRLRKPGQALPPATPLPRAPVWRGHGVCTPGTGDGEDGMPEAMGCESAALLPAPGAARRSHFASLARLLPAHLRGISLRKGVCRVSIRQCQGEGQAEEGDINWSNLKICRAWNDLDYQRVESRNFPFHHHLKWEPAKSA